MLTLPLVDYAFSLLGHALPCVVKLVAFCLFLKKMGRSFPSSKRCHSSLSTCHSPTEEARWLLLPSHSPPVICLWRKTECTAQCTAEKRGSSRIYWGKEPPVHIQSLCPARIKYFLVWGLNKGKHTRGLLVTVVSVPEKRSPQLLRGTTEMRWTPEEEIKAKRGGGEYSATEKPPGWGWVLTQGSSPATVDSRQLIQHHCTAFSAATESWGFVITRWSYSLQGTLSPQCFSYPKWFCKLYPLEVGRDKYCIYTKYSIGINITAILVWQMSQRDLTAMVQKWCFKVNVCFFPIYCSLLCS